MVAGLEPGDSWLVHAQDASQGRDVSNGFLAYKENVEDSEEYERGGDAE